MGVIQKQALRTTVISFLGIGIGMISQISLPFILDDKEQIGVLQLLNSVSRIFATIFCFGFTQIAMLTFANFRNEKKGHSGFLIFAIIFSLGGIALGELVFFLTRDFFIGVGDEYKLVRSLSYLIFPIIFFRIIYSNLDIYFRLLYKSVTGAFLEQVLLKFFILMSLMLFFLGWIDYEHMAIVYAFALSLPGIVILVLAFKSEDKIVWPKKELFTAEAKRKMMGYGLFGVISSASGVIIVSIDSVMINKMMSTADVGVYSVLFFAGTLVSVPSRGIKRISITVLSEAWKSKNEKEITDVYQKSVINQTVIGVYFFILGWLCIAPALTFLPKYQDGLYVFFFIGLGQLFDMMTGVNAEIIGTSEKFRVNTYFNITLALLVIGFNFFFIQEWGIVGAAAASGLAILLVNLARWYYLKKVFGFQPFVPKVAFVALLGVVIVVLGVLVPLPFTPVLQMITYTILVTILFWAVVLKFNLAPDLSAWILKMKHKFIGK